MKTAILFLGMAIVLIAQPVPTPITVGQTPVNGGINGDCLKVGAGARLAQGTCGGGGGGSPSGPVGSVQLSNGATFGSDTALFFSTSTNRKSLRVGTASPQSADLTIQASAADTLTGTTTATGTGCATAPYTLVGIGSLFLSQLSPGDLIAVSTGPIEYVTVLSISSNTSAVVDCSLGNGTSQTMTAKHGTLLSYDLSGNPVMGFSNNQWWQQGPAGAVLNQGLEYLGYYALWDTVTDASFGNGSSYSQINLVTNYSSSRSQSAVSQEVDMTVNGSNFPPTAFAITGSAVISGTGTGIQYIAGVQAGGQLSAGSGSKITAVRAQGAITGGTAIDYVTSVYADTSCTGGTTAGCYGMYVDSPFFGGTITAIKAAYFNENYGAGAFSWYSKGGTLHAETGAATNVGLEIERFSMQSADFLRLLDSDGTTVLTSIPAAGIVKATTGTRFVCISTTGVLASSAAACSGT